MAGHGSVRKALAHRAGHRRDEDEDEIGICDFRDGDGGDGVGNGAMGAGADGRSKDPATVQGIVQKRVRALRKRFRFRPAECHVHHGKGTGVRRSLHRHLRSDRESRCDNVAVRAAEVRRQM